MKTHDTLPLGNARDDLAWQVADLEARLRAAARQREAEVEAAREAELRLAAAEQRLTEYYEVCAALHRPSPHKVGRCCGVHTQDSLVKLPLPAGPTQCSPSRQNSKA
jgi:hypothetical protein